MIRNGVRGLVLLSAALWVVPSAVSAPSTRDFDGMTPAPGLSRGANERLNADDAGKLADAIQTALCDADASITAPPAAAPAGPGATAPAAAPACDPATAALNATPDADYVRLFRKSLENRIRGAYGLATDQDLPDAALSFLPSLDATALASPVFAQNLRALYLEQIKSLRKLAHPELAVVKTRVAGGSLIPQAKDVVLLTNVVEGPAVSVCTGTIISDTAVEPKPGENDPGTRILTAAHCICAWLRGQAIGKMTISVRVGIDSSAERAFTAFRIRENGVQIMDGVACPANSDDEAAILAATRGKDLAVVTTTESIPHRIALSRPILSPTSLGAWQHGPNSYFVRVGGYGYSSPYISAVSVIGVRYFADMAVTSYDCSAPGGVQDCQSNYEFAAAGPRADVVNTVNDLSTLRDKDKKYFGTCQGDSGGPVYASQSPTNQLDRFYLVGVVRGAQMTCGGYSVLSLLPTQRAVCWLKKVAPEARFVLADGTTDPNPATCP